MPDATFSADQYLPLDIDPASVTDREGNPAKIENVTWATSDPTVATVEPMNDGMSANIISHRAGNATILIEADADLGEGERVINGTFSVEVTGGQAAAIKVTAGQPVEKAPAEKPEDTVFGGEDQPGA